MGLYTQSSKESTCDNKVEGIKKTGCLTLFRLGLHSMYSPHAEFTWKTADLGLFIACRVCSLWIVELWVVCWTAGCCSENPQVKQHGMLQRQQVICQLHGTVPKHRPLATMAGWDVICPTTGTVPTHTKLPQWQVGMLYANCMLQCQQILCNKGRLGCSSPGSVRTRIKTRVKTRVKTDMMDHTVPGTTSTAALTLQVEWQGILNCLWRLWTFPL